MSSDGKREGFLRLTGTGALVRTDSGALQIGEAMSPSGDRHIPLFGSDYVSEGAIPTLTHILNHIVYWRLRDLTVNRQISQSQKDEALKESYSHYGGAEVKVVGKIRKRFGGTRSLVVGGSEWHADDPEARVIMVNNPPGVWESGDPHVLFFTMALKMRQRFAQNALEMFQKIPDTYRAKATLLTEIGTPICTYTRPDIGFDIGCEFSQRLTMETFDPEVVLEDGQLYSKTGEYPVEIPHDIDVERLMRIDLKAAQNPHLLVSGIDDIQV